MPERPTTHDEHSAPEPQPLRIAFQDLHALPPAADSPKATESPCILSFLTDDSAIQTLRQAHADAPPATFAVTVILAYLSRLAEQTEFGLTLQRPGRDRPESVSIQIAPDADLAAVLTTTSEVLASQVLLSDTDDAMPVGAAALAIVDSLSDACAIDGTPMTVFVESATGRAALASAHLVTPAQLRTLASSLHAFVHAWADAPAMPLRDLPIVSTATRELLLKWSTRPGTAAPTGAPVLVHRWIEASVAAHANAIALIAGDDELTFDEVNRRANRLARRLVEQGIEPDQLIGVLCARGANMVVAILAVLKSGGAYLPLDPAYPTARLEFMISDSSVEIMITDTESPVIVHNFAGTTIALEPSPPAAGSAEDERNLEHEGHVSNLAYMCYTSGSTGNPKGIPIEHRQAMSFLAAMNDTIEHTTRGTWLALTSLSFDPSLVELLWTLGHGFKVVIAGVESKPSPRGTGSESALLNQIRTLHRTLLDADAGGQPPGVGIGPDRLQVTRTTLHAIGEELKAATPDEVNVSVGALIRRHSCTHLQCTPSKARMLLLTPDEATALAHLRQLFVGGEALPTALADQLNAAVSADCGAGSVVNLYGPTEATVWATAHRHVTTAHPASTETDASQEPTVVSLGRPLGHCSVYVLGRNEQLLPPGLPGELCIGGAAIGRGYHDRPNQTQDRFRVDPHVPPGATLYRTGDLARWDEAGTLHFLGRSDAQLKILGHRVEAGEIETHLRTHPAIRDAAVVVREDRPGAPRLTAFVHLRGESLRADAAAAESATPPPDDLRSYLAGHLPTALVPSVFVRVPALPLGPTGKIDRNFLTHGAPGGTQLPQAGADAGAVAGDRSGDSPAAIEAALQKIWEDTLRTPVPSPHADFFALGGHSLLAVMLLAATEREFRIAQPLPEFLRGPTIAQQARSIATAQSNDTPAYSHSEQIALQPRPGALPLSAAQERLWFLERLQTQTMQQLAFAEVLHGSLDREALAAAISAAVARHEILRTRYVTEDGAPRQVVDHPIRAELRVRPLLVSGTPGAAAAVEQAVLAHVGAELRAPLDLQRGPCWRATLLEVTPEHHVLIFVVHHIAADGWSLTVLRNDILLAYQREVSGDASHPLSAPPVQYLDASAWLATRAAAARDDQLAYWRQRLAGAPTLLQLPVDTPRAPERRHRAGWVHKTVRPELTHGVQAWTQTEECSLFVGLLTALQLLLARLTGATDIVVGAPVTQRPHTGLLDAVGLFLNHLALRTQIPTEGDLRELLRQVRDQTHRDLAHQDVSFEEVIAVAQPERHNSHSPLFQVFLNVLSVPIDEVQIPEIETQSIVPDEPVANFDITLYAQPLADSLELRLVYDADLFSQERMVEFLEQFEGILAQLVQTPTAPIAGLELQTPLARRIQRQLATPLPCAPWLGPVHSLIQHQANAVPDATAILHRGEAWTRAQLRRGIQEVVDGLRREGVQREDIVVIVGVRAAELPVAVLGTLAAGAVATILDSRHPTARVLSCLRQLEPRAVVRPAGAQLPHLVEESLTSLPQITATLRGQFPNATQPTTGDAVADDFEATAPALLTFTSGSTGEPMSVLGQHGSLTAFLPWQTNTFQLTEHDRYSMLAGLSHDPLQREIFTSLASGATLCIPDEEMLDQPSLLLHWLRDQGMTVLHLTPGWIRLLTAAQSHATQNAESPNAECLVDVRLAFVTGEAFLPADALALQQLAPNATIVNLFGATETQRAVGHFVLPPNTDPGALSPLPAGRGVDGADLLVLDPELRPCGVGEPGEICIRSRYLARGYPTDPGRTTTRFVANPHAPADDKEDRIYRTGDRGRLRPDGTVDYLGRTDQQIQVRGVRVEPAEIETALRRLGAVEDAAVRGRDQGTEVVLEAHIVLARPSAATTAELRAALQAVLPPAMIPAAFAIRASLPRTANGKLDRKSLPEIALTPENDDSAPSTTQHLPRSADEARLLAAWRRILQRPDAGMNDDFFELGGHSLLAVRLFAEIAQDFGADLPLSTLFNSPTVSALAPLVFEAQEAATWRYLVPLQTGGSRAPLFVIHGAGGNVLSYRHLASALGDQQPVYGLQAPGLDGASIEVDLLEELARVYVSEITDVQPTGPYALAGYSAGGWVAFEVARQLAGQGHAVGRLFLFDTWFQDPHPTAIVRLLGAFQKPEGGSLWQALRGQVRRVKQSYRQWRAAAQIKRHLATGSVVPVHLRHQHVFDANLSLVRAYTPEPVNAPITYMSSSDPRSTLTPELRARWSRLSTTVIEHLALPGLHDGVMQAATAAAWAAAVQERLGHAEPLGYAEPLSAPSAGTAHPKGAP